MAIETVYDCPLGSTCETIIDDTIHRCAWYTQMAGVDPAGEDVHESKCAMAWLPILSVESSGATRSVAAAVESLRNVQHANVEKIQDVLKLQANIRLGPRRLT